MSTNNETATIADFDEDPIDRVIAASQAAIRIAEAIRGLPLEVAASAVKDLLNKLSSALDTSASTTSASTTPSAPLSVSPLEFAPAVMQTERPRRGRRPSGLTDEERKAKAAEYQRLYRARRKEQHVRLITERHERLAKARAAKAARRAQQTQNP